MITEWEDLVGKTIVRELDFFLGGRVLFFKDGEYAYISAGGEERHGAHWPYLSDEDIEKYLDPSDEDIEKYLAMQEAA